MQDKLLVSAAFIYNRVDVKACEKAARHDIHCPTCCVLQVKMVLEKLYENKKIASATHNIYAYRSVIYVKVIMILLLVFYSFIMQTMLPQVSVTVSH